MKKLIFIHANGYLPGAYQELLELLKLNYRVEAFEFRALNGDPKNYKGKDWTLFAEELLSFLDKTQEKVSLVGHSMGAVIGGICAAKKPEYIEKLILLDPVILNSFIVTMMRWLPQWWKRKYIPIVRSAHNRREYFKDRNEAWEYFREKKVFKNFSDGSLRNYVSSGIIDHDGTWQLKYSKKWEEFCYCAVVDSLKIFKNLDIPTLGIIGEHSNIFNPQKIEKWKGVQNQVQIEIVKRGTHLFPLENPQECAKIILQFL